MSVSILRPSSIEGIKRLAKSIKRERRIPHMQALDAAARQAGYENILHAKNALTAMHQVYVSSYWRVADGSEGRETMMCRLRRPLNELMELSGSGDSFYGYRMDALDHLEERSDRSEQRFARDSILQTIRHLQFADTTKLRPWAGESIREFEWASDLPGRDHASAWVDPATGAAIFVDEPYTDRESLLGRRQEWAKHRGVLVAAPQWEGMYRPEDSTLFLACKQENETLLAQIARALDKAAPPVARWTGESAPYHPTFISPMRLESGSPKKSRPKRIPDGTVRDGAIVVGSLPESRWWRPNAKMPLAAHLIAAAEVRAAAAWVGYAQNAAYRKHIQGIRDRLDTWLGEEYRRSASERFDREMYYGRLDGHLKQTPVLKLLRALIIEHYPDCAPRRRLLRNVDAAIRIVEKNSAKRPAQ